MSKIVQIAELSVYGEEDQVILENLSFNLEQGEIAQLVGLSEQQYDALFHVLTGEISPDSGQVVLADRNVVRLSGKNRNKMLRKEVSFLPRDFTLPKGKTVREALKFKLETLGGVPEIEERLDDVIQLTELAGIEESPTGDQDSLTRIKTGVALSVVNEPDLLICHETFSSLNSKEEEDFVKLLAKINEQNGLSILLLTDEMKSGYEKIRAIEHKLDSRVIS